MTTKMDLSVTIASNKTGEMVLSPKFEDYLPGSLDTPLLTHNPSFTMSLPRNRVLSEGYVKDRDHQAAPGAMRTAPGPANYLPPYQKVKTQSPVYSMRY